MKTWAVVMVMAGGHVACGGAEEAGGDDTVDASVNQPDGGIAPDTSVTSDVEPDDETTTPASDITPTPDAVEAVVDAGAQDAGAQDAGAVDTTTTTEPDAEAPCLPECAGKTCGADGCGGTCGDCIGGEACNDQGACGSGCTPACAPSNACGEDGCGGFCGSCSGGGICTAGMCCGPGPHNDCECWIDADCAATSDACEGAEVCNDTGGCVEVPDSAMTCADGQLCIDSACVNCDPSGTSVMETTSASPPGEGCGPEGTPEQGPKTQTYVITVEEDGSFSVVTLEPVDPPVEIVVTLVAGDPCSFTFAVSTTVDFPSNAETEGGTESTHYLYTVSLNDGLYLGTGTVQTTYATESGEAQEDCTEAISVSGTFTPAG